MVCPIEQFIFISNTDYITVASRCINNFFYIHRMSKTIPTQPPAGSAESKKVSKSPSKAASLYVFGSLFHERGRTYHLTLIPQMRVPFYKGYFSNITMRPFRLKQSPIPIFIT